MALDGVVERYLGLQDGGVGVVPYKHLVVVAAVVAAVPDTVTAPGPSGPVRGRLVSVFVVQVRL